MTKRKDPKDFKKDGRPIEYTPTKLDKLGKELITCVNLEHVFNIGYFESVENDHGPGWLKEICKRHPKFRLTLQRAQNILGNKILSLGATSGINTWYLKVLTPYYLSDVKDHITSEKELDAKIDLESKKKLEKFKREIGLAEGEDISAKIADMKMTVEMINKNDALSKENKKLKAKMKKLKESNG